MFGCLSKRLLSGLNVAWFLLIWYCSMVSIVLKFIYLLAGFLAKSYWDVSAFFAVASKHPLLSVWDSLIEPSGNFVPAHRIILQFLICLVLLKLNIEIENCSDPDLSRKEWPAILFCRCLLQYICTRVSYWIRDHVVTEYASYTCWVLGTEP